MNRESALDFLIRLAEGMGTMFGQNCEVVIHDMDNFAQSIVYIVNGQVTQRNLGDEFKIVGVNEIDRFIAGTDLINCKAITGDRRTLKTSTFHLKGDDYHFALGINYDYTVLSYVQNALGELTSVGEDIDQAIGGSASSGDMLEPLFEEAMKLTTKPIAMLGKEDRLELVRALDARGAFSLQKSIPLVAHKLNISRHTLYNYLREIRGNNNA